MQVSLKNKIKKIPYISPVYRFLFRRLISVKNRIPRSYRNWIKKSESFNSSVELNIKPNICVVLDNPKFSIETLNEIIDSILTQKFAAYRIFVILKGEQSLSKKYLEHRKIQVFSCSDSMSWGKGEWILFVNHYELFNEHTLKEFAFAIQQNQNTKLFYSDHDILDINGKRSEPNFKPSWNPDLFYEQEYIHGCCVVRLDFFEKYLDKNSIDSRDAFYEFIIYASKNISNFEFGHIDKVLFHFKKILSPLDASQAEKTLQNYVNKAATVRQINCRLKIDWPLPTKKPLVSLIIPTRNGLEILSQAVNSIVDRTNYKNYEIIIVNNQSDDRDTIDYLEKVVTDHCNISVLDYDYAFNYSAINNFAVSKAKGSIIGFINNDIEVISPGWLNEMVAQAVRDEIGCVGAKLYYPNETIQHAGVIVGLWGCAGHSHKGFKRTSSGYCGRLNSVQNYSAVTAACLLVRKETFHAAGGFNENDLKVAFNDVDFCLKVRELGLQNLWTPYAELYHHESVSRGIDTTPEQIDRANREVEYMRKTWKIHQNVDPFYNANLTINAEDFTLVRR